MGLGEQAAGKHVPFYWGGAMVGRFVGAVRAAEVLAGQGARQRRGRRDRPAAGHLGEHRAAVAGWALLAVGLFNSIMFPTIFSLASEGLGARAAEGSGMIAIAIVGGAIVPPCPATSRTSRA